ncbi:MAG: hypothetical protein H6869_01625 [Rhodospirillales bacterium]|nr:hypothetical protein [Rhodospirillales bacterium]
MLTKDNHEVSGQYYRVDDRTVLNLGTLTSLWRSRGGLFGNKEHRLSYSSTGESLSVPLAEDQIKTLFNKLADDGTFIRIGEKLINTKTLQSLRYESGKLYYQQPGDDGEEKISRADADAIFSRLTEQKRFMRIGDHVVNMNKVVNAWFVKSGFLSNSSLHINFMGSSNIEIDMERQKAQAVMADMTQRPQFSMVGKEVVNVALGGNVWIEGKDLHITYPGTSCTVPIEESRAATVMGLFSDKFGYETVAGQKLNRNITSSLWAYKGGWFFGRDDLSFKILNKEGYINTSFEKAKAVRDKMADGDDYVRIDKFAENINSLAYLRYDGKRLYMRQGTSDSDYKMDRDSAETLLAKVARNEKFVQVGDWLVNVEMIGGAAYDDKTLALRVGQATKDVRLSEEQAKAVLDKICAYGEDKKMAELKRREAMNEDPSIAFDADLLADVYEEIASAQTNTLVMMVAVNAAVSASVSAGR